MYNASGLFAGTDLTVELPAVALKALSRSVSSHFLLVCVGLALVAGLLGVLFWYIDALPIVQSAFVLVPRNPGEHLITPGFWLGFAIIVSFAAATGLVIGSVGAREAFPFLAVSYLSLAVISLIGSRYFAIDIVYVASLVGSLIAAFAVQTARLWVVDRELTRLLMSSAGGAFPDGVGEANSRLMSGLKLLETELALTEAVVFHWQNETFSTVARLRPSGNTGQLTSRNSAWREGIKLCERAAASRQIITHLDKSARAISVAVPLRYENFTVGAMLLRLSEALRDEDHSLLTAVGAQMARNLQREEFFRTGATSQASDYFSAKAGQKKLSALFVMAGLLTENRCGENVLANVSDGVAIARLDGTLAFVNSELQRLAGIAPWEVKALNIFGLLDRFRTDVFDEPAIAVRRVLQSGVPYEGELAFSGQSTILGLRISLVRDLRQTNSAGEPLGLAIYVRDLTRVKEYEQLKSDMISLMSHELRTPLTSINGFAELLSHEPGLPEQAKEFVTIINNESQRLSRMINTFLAVTQLERKDKQEVLKIPLRVDEVVRETISSLQPVAKKKRIRLVEEPAQRLPPVAADKSLITQAVRNLVNNAIKYSPERTTVTVSTALEAEAVRVSVEDRGYGIPPESIDKVWEKFYRVVREGQEKDEESTGLGLSFVREVVEQHGGRVDLRSEVGRGSKFSFTLPRL
jgi:two-component system phosphate regulon sensor histidine kinase PhoR